MNKRTKNVVAKSLLFIMICSNIVVIINALKIGSTTQQVMKTTEENIIEGPICISVSENKALMQSISEISMLEINSSQDDSKTQGINRTVTKEVPIESKNLAKDKTEYKYYKIVDNGHQKMLSKELQKYTYDLCVEYDIAEYFTLILCQLYKESSYREDIISESNDYGIAQINICNHKWLSKELGITDFLDPKQSILCNIFIMSRNLKKYNVESALVCYNTGKPYTSNPYARDIISLWNNCIVEIEE